MKLFKSSLTIPAIILITGTVFLITNGNFNISPQSPPSKKDQSSNDIYSVSKPVVTQQKDEITAELKNLNSRMNFSLKSPNAKETKDGETTSYEISENTTVKYEQLEPDEKTRGGLKETIVLKDNTASNTYVFDLYLENVDIYEQYTTDKSWHFYDKVRQEVFYIPPGFMIDAKGQKSEEVDIQIEKNKQQGEDQYTLTVTADKNWLASPQREYPVEIDPTVVLSQTDYDALSDLTVAGTTTANATKTRATSGSGGTATLVVVDTTGFAANDWVLVIQMTSTGGTAGDFEERKILTVDNGTQVTFTANKTNGYGTGAQMIKLDVYDDITVQNGGTLTADTYGGTTGGVLYVIGDTLTVDSGGLVDMNGKGGAGGTAGTAGAAGSVGNAGSAGGAGGTGSGPSGGDGANAQSRGGSQGFIADGGGGGGSGGGGEGGSYVASGTDGTVGAAGGDGGGNAGSGGTASTQGSGSSAVGCADFSDSTGCLFMGSGGGGGAGGAGGGGGDSTPGGAGGDGGIGGAGGNGGGISNLTTNTWSNSGTVRTN